MLLPRQIMKDLTKPSLVIYHALSMLEEGGELTAVHIMERVNKYRST